MAAADAMLVFPDEGELKAQKREREREERQQTEEKLQLMGLDLLNRWDELRVEVNGVEAISNALGADANDSGQRRTETQAHIRAATRAVPDAIITFTADGLIRSFNSGAERMFGRRIDEVLNTEITALLPAARQLIDALARGHTEAEQAPSSTEGIGLKADGGEIEVDISIGVTEIDSIRYHAAVVRDVSERARARRELERLNGSLQDQVRETEAALSRLHEAQKQLVQAEKMASLGLLVAGVAHEINTPLGIAVTAASVLGDQAAAVEQGLKTGTLKKSQLESAVQSFSCSAEMILSNLQRAATLVQSFKRVAVDQGSEEWRQIDLADYLHEVMLSLQPQVRCTPHRLELDCPAGLVLHTAPGALAQILTNFVMNSLIHAWDDGSAGLMRLNVWREGERLRITYSDDGRGLSAEALPLIFDPFYTTRRGDGGSGLGLHIVFNLVHQTLSGTIAATSRLGEGLSFDLSIPIRLDATASLPPHRDSTP